MLILGSTGSIGVQALEVIAEHPDRFTVAGLGAGGGNIDRLAQQAADFGVPASRLAVADAARAAELARRLDAPVIGGPDAMVDLIESVAADDGVDVVLNAVVGSIGLAPRLAALRVGARLALANKELLVAGGSLVLYVAAPGQIVPVDSEHSAIAQCLRAGTVAEVDRLVLTASGGPFRGWTREQLEGVTPEQAGKHPTWSMGPMITLNSATLVNKALEVIEAHLLFDVDYDHIDVTVHPQSIVHSMVTFVDGATVAKASPPSMKLPIALALGLARPGARLVAGVRLLDRVGVDLRAGRRRDLPGHRARARGRPGRRQPDRVYNAANEAAAEGFFAGAIRFPRIVEIVGEVLGEADQWRAEPGTVEEVFAADRWARERASALVAASS